MIPKRISARRLNAARHALAGTYVVFAVACSAYSSLGGPEKPSANEANVRRFLLDLETAVIDWNWVLVEEAFAEEAEMTLIGPPPDLRRFPVTKAEMLESFQADAMRPGYKRSRSIQSIELADDRRTATARSVVEEAHTDSEDRTVSARFLETAVIRLDRGPMKIVGYVAEVVGLPARE